MLCGETFLPELRFLRESPQLPGLFVVSDDDEYPPTVEAMELLYTNSPNPGKKFVHYSASQEGPWLWYEPFDIGKVPANGNHGTDLLQKHPELPGILVCQDTDPNTGARSGGLPCLYANAPANRNARRGRGGYPAIACSPAKDPEAQLSPEITVDIIGADHLRLGEAKAADQLFHLLVLAYSNSADAQNDLADVYLANGQKDLA